MIGRLLAAVAVAMSIGIGVAAPQARADGDPGSDVLVFQNLFVAGDAGLSVSQQARLGDLLTAAARKRFPIRVAIIATPSDLGSVTALWRKPQAYAKFLGFELSLTYRQRLLIVMPNGFGFNWPGHRVAAAYALLDRTPIGSGAGGLFDATQAAVTALARADSVVLAASAGRLTGGAGSSKAPSSQPAASPTVPSTAGAGGSSASSGQAKDTAVAIGAAALALLAAVVFGVRYVLRRRPPASDRRGTTHQRPELSRPARRALGAAALCVGVLALPIVLIAARGGSAPAVSDALAFNPVLDPGTRLSGTARDFTLTDQFGQPVSLRSFRGKVVILAFTDSECTTECPLTTTAMLDAKAMLGRAGDRVQLLGIDADPAATSLEDVWSYSELHGMLRQWDFLTGSLPQLRRVWKAYGVEAAIAHGEITHTPALFAISPQGTRAKVYITQMSYSAVPQAGQLLAQEASSLLPGHPRVQSHLSYARIPATTPTERVMLPRVGGGSVRLGPGGSARLLLFFATWDRETTSLAGQLVALNGYAAAARRLGLPPLTAVDEASVEPSRGVLPAFLRTLPRPLSYPVAIDGSGRVADGYEALGQPWLTLVSSTGRLLWYRSVSVAGWPDRKVLIRYVRAALAWGAANPVSGATLAARSLAGSPAPLAALHAQASELVGSQSGLTGRLRAVRGYPVVINVWASWCTPCRSEFGLFAAASSRYGRRVAFLGADSDDSASDARAFLAQHHVSYPSYQTSPSDLSSLAVIEGLPTTIFINHAGKVVFVHTGQYDSLGSLYQDIQTYAS